MSRLIGILNQRFLLWHRPRRRGDVKAMHQYRIDGGQKIRGTLSIGGAKNAILPILAAVCLNKGVSKIHNCPPIADTLTSISILEKIGCAVQLESTTLTVDASASLSHHIPAEMVGKMRSSILFMGAMLGRCGQVNIAMPGGCKLGARAIDLHLSGLAAMGATVCIQADKIHCQAPRLKGANISLHTASVGATQNLMLAATKAHGVTVIQNAAKEPEVVDLANFLITLGADIKGAGTSQISICGVEELHQPQATPYTIMPDRIVAGTYLVAAA
ncbi:MAG: UDP-N-acetylglucosamine 1-carboxyvinyltransferase, partial [Defluviitaleaceae bacterium]|nr:UDP-N-acetylglucosamine 1-carboxyvinyltransferase [Defluviitaleaceae bacterium]